VGQQSHRQSRRASERDVSDLLPNLQQRVEAVATKAAEQLAARGEKEAKELADKVTASSLGFGFLSTAIIGSAAQ
jgi:hypothetical protein